MEWIILVMLAEAIYTQSYGALYGVGKKHPNPGVGCQRTGCSEPDK